MIKLPYQAISSVSKAYLVFVFFRYLNWSITEGSGIRKADGRSVISRVASSNIGRDLAFDFMRDKWQNVVD
jgi:hypothetical protein